MSTGFIVTRSGILVVDGRDAMHAATHYMRSAIDSGEAAVYIIRGADSAAPIVSTYGDAQTTLTLMRDALSQNYNAYVRDSFAAVLGTLAGTAALPAGPTAALAADAGVSISFSNAYDSANNWAKNHDWGPLFDALEQLQSIFLRFMLFLFPESLRDALGSWVQVQSNMYLIEDTLDHAATVTDKKTTRGKTWTDAIAEDGRNCRETPRQRRGTTVTSTVMA